jgi:acetylornithine deacetylase/succinyl-diaminopimelate desuccinylase-like protein
MSAPGVEDEVVALAQQLIRIDTSNPPGNETPAAELLCSYLRDAGAECELAGPDPDRLNLIARIQGGGGPSLLLLGHTDVVPAPPDGWSVGPFDGAMRDGHVVGRGAADMKGELASRAVALATLARSGERPAGDVVLIAEADEERNTAGVGMSWLVRERADLRCDFALNEGGGLLLELADGRRVVTVAVGEQKVSSLRIRLRGRGGHASVPAGADNPVGHAATAVERLIAHQAPTRLDPSLAAALEALGAPSSSDDAVAWARDQHPYLADMVPAMTRLSVTPTGLQTFEPSNVIPPLADVICDCRALPGQGIEEIRDHVGEALGDGLDYELELLEPLEGGTESRIDTPLYRACEEFVAQRFPGAKLLPLVTPGFSDSHWVRRAHGTVAYGFAPVFTTDLDAYLDGAHGSDECLAVADLVEMTEFNLHAIRSLSQVGS